MAAGLSHWEFGRFDLFPVNPPLVRNIATLPVSIGGYNADWTHYGTDCRRRREFTVGHAFVIANSHSFQHLFTIARWACIPLSLLGAVVCGRWASELFGESSGWGAILLWCVSPTILAFGSTIAPDVGAAACGITASYCFRKWLLSPGWLNLVLAGVAVGAAVLTKFTWLGFYFLCPVLWGVYRFGGNGFFATGYLRSATDLAGLLLISIYVVNVGYGFEDTLRPLDTFLFHSEALSGIDVREEGEANRFVGSVVGRIPIPFPGPVLRGVDHLKSEFEIGYWSYLGGEYRHGGWWYYYIYAALVKLPLGTLLMAALSLTLVGRNLGDKSCVVEYVLLLLPAVFVFIFVSSQTGFNHHFRYVLPALPAVFIFASQGLSDFVRHGTRFFAATCLVGTIASSLFVYPHSMSFFNFGVGGPEYGRDHLSCSSLDWGQDMCLLKEWQLQHAGSLPLYVKSSCMISPRRFGIVSERFPALGASAKGFPSGIYAIGLTQLMEHESKLRPFRDIEPIDRIGYSMFIYELDHTLKIPQ